MVYCPKCGHKFKKIKWEQETFDTFIATKTCPECKFLITFYDRSLVEQTGGILVEFD